MLTFLDLLIVVVMTMAAVSLAAICFMFYSKNKIVKHICFYIVAVLGIYLGYVGFRILWPGFMIQVIFAAAMALVSIISILMVLLNKGNEKSFKIARSMASAALVVGMFNAFIV